MQPNMTSVRLSRIDRLLATYASVSGHDAIDQATDLMTDLLHWCEAEGVQPIILLDRASWHFVEESGFPGPKAMN